MSNRFDPLSDSEDDDVSLAESMTYAAAIPTVTRSPHLHVFYCNYAALKRSILRSVHIHRDSTFKILMNNLVVRAAKIADYTKIAEFLKIQKIEYFNNNASTN